MLKALQIIILLAPIVLLISLFFHKKLKWIKVNALIVLFFIHLAITIFVIIAQPFDNILKMSSDSITENHISLACDIIGVLSTIIIAILDNRVPLFSFNQLKLSPSGNDSNDNAIISANLCNNDIDYVEDKLNINIVDAKIYIVLLKELFEYEDIFNIKKNNNNYCRKIILENIVNTTVRIEEYNNRPNVSFNIIDKHSYFDDILSKDAHLFDDRKMLVLSLKYRIFKDNIFDRNLIHIYNKLKIRHGLKTKKLFFILDDSNNTNDEYIFKISTTKKTVNRSNSNE